MPTPATKSDTAHAIGELCLAGDWACFHGDFVGLRDVATGLAAYLPEPRHCQLVELAEACAADPDRAGVLWDRLKDSIYRGDA